MPWCWLRCSVCAYGGASRSAAGIENIAPYSQWQNLTFDPPMVMFAANRYPDGRRKDTVLNAEETGWFVWNMATYALREAVNISAMALPPQESEWDRLDAVNALALALSPSRERHLETAMQGRSFAAAIGDSWPCAAVVALRQRTGTDIAYPVAVGAAAAGHGIPLDAVVAAYLHGFVANLVSAGVRLVPLGQTDGQRALVALETAVAAAARQALLSDLDDLGGAMFRADIGSMKHETQYTRLFRS